MRAVITGGAGFIGSHLAEALLGRDDEVSVLDDLSTGRRENVRHLEDHPAFSFHLGSAADADRVARVLEGADVVFHLAAAVGVRLIIEKPVHTIETNVGATAVVLRAAARQGIPVVFTSTSEVYGKWDEAPFREDQDLHLGPTCRSRWSYACSKALDEWLALAWFREEGLPVVIARLFNTVGPRQEGRYGMVLPTFVRQALREEPITVFGDGGQSRCFAHVGDVVEALLLLSRTRRAHGQVVNVGSAREISIGDLARLVRERTGSRSPIVHVPYAEAYERGFEDMRRRVPDLRRLRELTGGFEPQTPLEEIIDQVILDQRREGGRAGRR